MSRSKRQTPPNNKVSEQQNAEPMVFILRRDTKCEQCQTEKGKGSFICLVGNQALCLECAGFSHLEFLPSGDTAVTRRATKHSSVRVVVMKKSSVRKRSERQGILVEPEAIRLAKEESEADADKRAQLQKKAAKRREKADREYVARFAKAIRDQYPGCPEEDEIEIAAHACEKYSGRVGRSAAAKEFDETAILLAVQAHIRHKHTDYDRLLNRHFTKKQARAEVQGTIVSILAQWGKADLGT